uniref:Small ribosomal subunit protein mS29 n=1 Tax=Timema shepardi TaxID=629360 RepID=A0A7R9G763_TIMSH|nr:unnamed protein product [Timema shepardi]
MRLRISKDYIWSKRETTKEGSSILELVEHGINRVKYSSDCIIALLKEIKTHSTHGRCKTLVAIDGFNAFFYPKTRVVDEYKAIIHPSKITLTEAFIEITKFDWSNGAVVVTVDQIAASDDRQASGFEHMDPFVPIRVSEYNAKEIESCLQYYIDRRWIQNPDLHTEDGRRELAFLSGNNPYHLMNMCTPL